MLTLTKNPRVEDLIEELKKKRKLRLFLKINRWNRKNPVLSDIGECDRQMVYGILNWEERPLQDEELQARFDEGNEQERKVIREIQEDGFDVILSQQPITINGKNGIILATGKIDGFIRWNGRKFPIEIKSMNPNVFNQIDSTEDFQKKAWLRKYLRQLQMYLFGNNQEMGLFILSDCLGHRKYLPVYLDYGECELILQRLEKVYFHLQGKTYPERIAYKDELCGKCPFAHICLQDIVNEGLPIIDESDLEAKLQEREALKPQVERYIELDDESKEIAKKMGKDFLVKASFKVEVKKSIQKRVDTKSMPIEIRSQYEKESEIVKVNFIPLNKKPG